MVRNARFGEIFTEELSLVSQSLDISGAASVGKNLQVSGNNIHFNTISLVSSKTNTYEHASNISPDTPANNFGGSVALGENIIAASDNSKTVYIFNTSGTETQQLQITDGDVVTSLAISRDLLVVGSTNNVYVYTSLTQTAVINIPATHVSIHENTIVVNGVHIYTRIIAGGEVTPNWALRSSFSNTEFSGSVSVYGDVITVAGTDGIYVYERVIPGGLLSQWKLLTKIDISEAVLSVAQYGNNIVAATADAVYIYSSLTQVARLTPTPTPTGFGRSVSATESHIVVGADEAAYIFNYDGTTWSQMKILEAVVGEVGDEFGAGVSINENHVIVGTQAGYIYIFSNEDLLGLIGRNGPTRFGIGTAIPTAALDIVGSLKVSGGVGLGSLDVEGDGKVGGSFEVGTSNLYVNTDTGKTGIGTLTPATELHVEGTGYFSSNLGIGTTEPQANLHVHGNVYVSSNLEVGEFVGIGTRGSDIYDSRLHIHDGIVRFSGNDTGIAMIEDGSDSGNLRIRSGYQGASNAPEIRLVGEGGGTDDTENNIELKTNGRTRLFVNKTGNVGIGTLTPTAWLHLGRDYTQPILSDQPMLRVDGDAIFPSSYVGIGTTDPQTTLHIHRGDILFSGGSFDYDTEIYNEGDGSDSGSLRIRSGYKSQPERAPEIRLVGYTGDDTGVLPTINKNNNIELRTDEEVRLFINRIGRVGIGTITPEQRLHVEGQSLFMNGNVGIGTTEPGQRLHVEGQAIFMNGNIGIGTDDPEQPLHVEGQTIIMNGNVGIGVTDPQYKLHVEGDINFTGSLLQNGSAFVGSRWSESNFGFSFPSYEQKTLYFNETHDNRPFNVGIGTNFVKGDGINHRLTVQGDIEYTNKLYRSGIPAFAPNFITCTTLYDFMEGFIYEGYYNRSTADENAHASRFIRDPWDFPAGPGTRHLMTFSEIGASETDYIDIDAAPGEDSDWMISKVFYVSNGTFSVDVSADDYMAITMVKLNDDGTQNFERRTDTDSFIIAGSISAGGTSNGTYEHTLQQGPGFYRVWIMCSNYRTVTHYRLKFDSGLGIFHNLKLGPLSIPIG